MPRHALPLAFAGSLALSACATYTAAPVVADAGEDDTVYASSDSFQTVEARLRAGIESRPLTLFTVVDHGQGAREAGTPIGESKLFLVGNPQVGTPFMLADPQMGLHLPLKILIHEDGDGTHLAYTHPGEAAARHGVAAEVAPQIERIHGVMDGLLSEAAGSSVRVVREP